MKVISDVAAEIKGIFVLEFDPHPPTCVRYLLALGSMMKILVIRKGLLFHAMF